MTVTSKSLPHQTLAVATTQMESTFQVGQRFQAEIIGKTV